VITSSPAQAFHTRGCIYQRRGGMSEPTDFAMTAIHSLQRYNGHSGLTGGATNFRQRPPCP
jgi:hypothetical protein